LTLERSGPRDMPIALDCLRNSQPELVISCPFNPAGKQ
jgi:hypothetical protein